MPPEEGNVVNDTAVEETAPTESTPVENNSPSADDSAQSTLADFDDEETDGDDWDDESDDQSEEETVSEPEPADEPEDEGDEPESEDEPAEDQPAEEQPSDEPQTKADKRKEQLNTEIRDLVAERNRIKQEVEQMNSDAYKPATVDELLEQENPDTGDYYNRTEAMVEAMRQEQQVRQYNEQVAESRLALQSDAQRALRDFPMFDENSPEFNKDLSARAEALLAPNIMVDPNTNQIIGSRVSPYTVYQTIADSYNAASTKSQAKAQKATEKMLASADPSPGAHHKPAPKDDGLDAFDEEANRW